MRPRSGGRPGAPGRRRRRLRRRPRGPRGRRLPPPPPLPLLLGLLLAAAGPGAARAKETAFVEVVLFESSPSGDYTTYTTGLTGRFSRAGATLSAEGEIVQVAARRRGHKMAPGAAPADPAAGWLEGGSSGGEAGGIVPGLAGRRDGGTAGRGLRGAAAGGDRPWWGGVGKGRRDRAPGGPPRGKGTVVHFCPSQVEVPRTTC
jgi:hypothetical protein